eukprot:gnl/Dysnectes_brevis/3661_a4678_1255.p1 GENE.gnl/Dysnectes_brevis/3661_a4678_1255~~gnl/Dysnectes_brevis/3661_a4678_1255.p1  ORF type:complete len:221 (+),score=33.46 gnl/Dysnectes_brevis/3661_a4678_1255:62-664(+)
MSFSEQSYWDDRYRSSSTLFDWYCQFNTYEKYITPFLKPESVILILGAGTSRVPFQLYDSGFKNVIAIDFSEAAKDVVQHEIDTRPGFRYEIMDVKTLDLESESVDVVLDKGTFDSLLTDPRPHQALDRALKEANRVLKTNGYLCSMSFSDDRSDAYELTAPLLQGRRQDVPKPVIEISAETIKKQEFFSLYLYQKRDVC